MKRFLFIFLFAGFFAAVTESNAAADDSEAGLDAPERPYGQAFSGLFSELSVRGALTELDDASGWSVDVGVRQALVMSLLDTRLAYRNDRFDSDFGEINQHGIEITGAFHPLYVAYLFSDWLGYVIGSIYLEGGVGVNFGTLNASGGNESDIGAMFSLGTGVDVPISDPDAGWSIWINLGYRYRFQDFDATDSEIELRGHHGFAGLALRFNRLLF